MLLLAKVSLIAVGTAVAGGAMISSEGFVHVDVHEKGPQGHNITIVAPATLLTTGLHFVPRQHLCAGLENMKEWGPAAQAAIDQLQRTDDFTLVEVSSKDQHVKIVKRNGAIVVDVNDTDESVHVSTPLRAIESALHEIQERASKDSKDSKDSGDSNDAHNLVD